MPPHGPIQSENLDLRNGAKNGAQITEKTTRKSVCDAVNVGLAIVSCSRGREAIRHVGTQVIQHSETGQQWAFDRKKHDMTKWVDRFLRKVGSEFLPVVLERMPNAMGKFTPGDWIQPGQDALKVWEPHMAGHVSLEALVNISSPNARGSAQRTTCVPSHDANSKLYDSTQMINDMALARENKEKSTYTILLFIAGITVAHELMHSFVRYLAGPFESRTPVDVTHPPDWFSQSWGESGFALEALLLGGCPHTYFKDNDLLGACQAGEIWFRLWSETETWAMVDPHSDCIQQITEGGPGKFKGNRRYEQYQGPHANASAEQTSRRHFRFAMRRHQNEGLEE